MKKQLLPLTILITALFIFKCNTGAQPVFAPWGNIKGIIVDGERMDFETSLRLVDRGWKGYVQTEKYNWEGKQSYIISGKIHSVSHDFAGLPVGFTSVMTETATGSARAEVSVTARDKTDAAGIYYCMEIPGNTFKGGTVTFFRNELPVKEINLSSQSKNEAGELTRIKADRVLMKSAKREYEIRSGTSREVILRSDFISQPAYLNDPSPKQVFVLADPEMKQANYQVYFTLVSGPPSRDRTVSGVFDIRATGEIDRAPLSFVLDTSKPGRPWDGIGGNFRLQFPDKDPAVIDYCLDNLDVRWSRLPFYWDQWHPEENIDPVANARAGRLSSGFEKQMQMAVRLSKMKIPVIFSVWWPPRWTEDPARKVPRGIILDNAKIDKIAASISSFFVYIKEVYGIEADYFSFNESDYGVEVFQTPEDHAFQLKAIGLALASKGLRTRLLIGDTGAGTARASRIMSEIIRDPELHKYAGFVSFHTYHGVTAPDLEAWAAAASSTNLPLMVAEGGSNSAAHRYELIFLQPWFQLDEIDKYIRICAACQPATIIEWQLTADYSVLTGNGLYGDNGPLRPTQRFWNLKQLGLTPPGSFAMPVRGSSPTVSNAAYGDILNGIYTLHFVNNGAAREASVSGLPESVKELQVYVTDAEGGMKKSASIEVNNGTAQFSLGAQSYTTLINKRPLN